jgi:bacteriocin-like protein
MKKINLKGISEILSEKELRNVTGGNFTVKVALDGKEGGDSGGGGGVCSAKASDCMGTTPCTKSDGTSGKCNTRPAETMCRCL